MTPVPLKMTPAAHWRCPGRALPCALSMGWRLCCGDDIPAFAGVIACQPTRQASSFESFVPRPSPGRRPPRRPFFFP